MDARGSTDPDHQDLTAAWIVYGEAGSHRGQVGLSTTRGWSTRLVAPVVKSTETIHMILRLSDDGQPPLCAYRRAIITVKP